MPQPLHHFAPKAGRHLSKTFPISLNLFYVLCASCNSGLYLIKNLRLLGHTIPLDLSRGKSHRSSSSSTQLTIAASHCSFVYSRLIHNLTSTLLGRCDSTAILNCGLTQQAAKL